METTSPPPTLDRRTQILNAAIACFARCGFHQTSMHDISREAGISVGLIYRYFANKEAVISAMADRHKKQIDDLLQQAMAAPTLLESLEIIFTAHCCETSPHIQSAFVVDLYAESSRSSCARSSAPDAGGRSRSDRARARKACGRARFETARPSRTDFCGRAGNVDARCIATFGDDAGGEADAAVGSDAKLVARVI